LEKNGTARAIILMGVAGAGKTTIGRLLADQLGWSFYDGDDFMPEANVAKMTSGRPLNDADRKPWLAILNRLIRAHLENGRCLVVGSSALKETYRQQLSHGVEVGQIHFIYLKGDFELLEQRMKERKGHYMKADMLASQFATLEEPQNALVINAAFSPNETVNKILLALGLRPSN
jgi:carbohydrate kinase (thermoresistant glucokinase family)